MRAYLRVISVRAASATSSSDAGGVLLSSSSACAACISSEDGARGSADSIFRGARIKNGSARAHALAGSLHLTPSKHFLPTSRVAAHSVSLRVIKKKMHKPQPLVLVSRPVIGGERKRKHEELCAENKRLRCELARLRAENARRRDENHTLRQATATLCEAHRNLRRAVLEAS